MAMLEQQVIFKLPGWNRFKDNEVVDVKMIMDKVHFFDPKTEKAIFRGFIMGQKLKNGSKELY